ncbi:Pantothenate kinase 2 [Dissostichus eleginoides]|uniref:Pantothenate kinase 2 n=1 Tax=Dissostichus eleginoides TaxID=100907 RepID=A0AAD9C4I3_DISEL|nr:Pantothenate kinase 2 [Dissostichus eleginoides]
MRWKKKGQQRRTAKGEEERRTRRRAARHGVSNKGSNLTAGGRGSQQHRRHPAPASYTALEAEQTGTDVSEEEEGGRLNERPEMAELLSEEQVIGPLTVAAIEREALTHTHARAHTPRSSPLPLFPDLIKVNV